MNDGPVSQGNAMIETTDSLEAVGVFRGWKNIFFVVVLICLLVTQVAFWLVDFKVVKVTGTSEAAVNASQPDLNEAAARSLAPVDANETEPAKRSLDLDKLDFGLLARIVGVASGVLVVTAVLYALAMFFCLNVSLVGRLGGINHIARGFILALIMAVLIIPWQRLLGPPIVGLVYSLDPELLVDWIPYKDKGTANLVIYYLRFSGYWFVVLLLLVLSQVRSARWSKAILRRLEII